MQRITRCECTQLTHRGSDRRPRALANCLAGFAFVLFGNRAVGSKKSLPLSIFNGVAKQRKPRKRFSKTAILQSTRRSGIFGTFSFKKAPTGLKGLTEEQIDNMLEDPAELPNLIRRWWNDPRPEIHHRGAPFESLLARATYFVLPDPGNVLDSGSLSEKTASIPLPSGTSQASKTTASNVSTSTTPKDDIIDDIVTYRNLEKPGTKFLSGSLRVQLGEQLCAWKNDPMGVYAERQSWASKKAGATVYDQVKSVISPLGSPSIGNFHTTRRRG